MNKKKPTIFISISVGMLARNLLNNDFYTILRNKYNIVIFTPLYNNKQFTNLYGGEDVEFYELKNYPTTRGKQLMKSLHGALIYNLTIKTHTHHGLSFKSKQNNTLIKRVKNLFEYLVFGLVLARLRFPRDMARYVDKLLFTHVCYDEAFDKYNPTLVFVTNVCADHDVQLVRAAKRNKVRTVGMTKSWDNFSQHGIREKTDVIAVWSEYMLDEVTKFQNYKKENVVVVGVPQFDMYHDIQKTHTYNDFCETYGMDPDKKTILFGQEAPIVSPDDPYVVSVIRDWISANNLSYQILVRPHFGHKGSVEAFSGLPDNKIVFLDTLNTPSDFAGGSWDYSTSHHERLALSMVFSDMVITSTSTLVLDSIAAGTETYCYAFDKDKNLPPEKSMVRFYETSWFSDLQKHGLKSHILNDETILLKTIKNVLSGKHPDKHVYDMIRQRFCYLVDGCSGKRLAELLELEEAKACSR